MREWPFPLSWRRNTHTVSYAVVNTEDKVSEVVVKQIPDRSVGDPIVQAFAKWVFRLAQLNGQPVAVKVLIGIPLL
jgi:hypothetical protein